MKEIRVLLIGKSGRVDVIADALKRSSHPVALFAFSEVHNPGLLEKCGCERVKTGITDNLEQVRKYARSVSPSFAVIGPEEPLAAGIVDMLEDELGIPCVGPGKSLARIESSKSFTRELLAKYKIPGNPEYRVFRSMDGLEPYLDSLDEYVLKPDGLTGGKGVQVFGEHFHSTQEALTYCNHVLRKQPIVVEEKLEGEEFSLQSFCDGQHVVDMVVVQDHKRSEIGDSGPNTGGMGSYSCADHLLPFLSEDELRDASRINQAVARALREEVGKEYKGILYGGFMVTRNGLRLIEYNARFGDPEVMNVLSLLRTDFVDICRSMIDGTLDRLDISFDKKATVCKYLVPEGYPNNAVKNVAIEKQSIPEATEQLRVYYGAVNRTDKGLFLTGSRAIAVVGIGDDLCEAERTAEHAVNQVVGPLRHRPDIGTRDLVQKRIDHMRLLRAEPTEETSAGLGVALAGSPLP